MREYDLSTGRWRKSTHSGGDGGESCVEVIDNVPGVVPVRDSKNPTGPVLVIGAASWTSFVEGVRRQAGSSPRPC